MKIVDSLDKYIPKYTDGNTVIINWGLTKIEDNLYYWYSNKFNHQPSKLELQNVINKEINEMVKNRITTSFIYDSCVIPMSIEDQLNYKLTFDTAHITDGANLPINIKHYNYKNEVQYYTIETMEEFNSFIVAMNNHIQNALKFGNDFKDSIEYESYV